MKWLNFSTVFGNQAKMTEHIQSLEHHIESLKSRLNHLSTEREELKAKAIALERLKKVFIDEGERFFFAAKTTKNRFAFVTLDKCFQEIKVWGEYTETSSAKLLEDCRLQYKFKVWQEVKSLQIVSISSSTQKQGYATLAIEALSRIAYIHDLKLITMKRPAGIENIEMLKACCQMGFKTLGEGGQIIGEFYKQI